MSRQNQAANGREHGERGRQFPAGRNVCVLLGLVCATLLAAAPALGQVATGFPRMEALGAALTP